MRRAAPNVSRTGETGVAAPYAIGQGFWGRGNLSPLDAQFGAHAVMRLVPTKGFGFVGFHLGQRLLKYADDMKVRVDAAEQDAALTRLYAKKNSSVRNVPGSSAFKPNRYDCFIALQASALGGPLDTLCQQISASLKARGKLFCADLMCRDGGCMPIKPGPSAHNGWRFQSYEAYAKAIQDACFDIEDTLDVSAALLASVRLGFNQSLSLLSELRDAGQAQRAGSMPFYLEQIETWGTIYGLLEGGKLQAMGILAAKRG